MFDYAEKVMELREAAEKSMCGECGLNLAKGSTKKGILFSDAADAIEELLAKVPTWISVEERLPEENKQIISYLAYKGMSVLQYENKHFYMQGAFQPLPKEAVTHWMPLPAPPKGGNHDN